LLAYQRALARAGFDGEQLVIAGRVAMVTLLGVNIDTVEARIVAHAALAGNGISPTPAKVPEVVGVEYLAERLCRKRSVIYDLVQRGKIPGRLDLGTSAVRFSKCAVDEWLAGGAEAVASLSRKVRRE
jgi:excisionase family DNA binding protein